METDPEKFHKTITRELIALQNRVRYLVGGAHWGEEGRYKEAALRSVIRRFLPTHISLGTGFVLARRDGTIDKTTQIDIIVYDNSYPLLFAEGDFVITTPENVVGIIEVKTSLDLSTIREVLSKATKNGRLINRDIFNGIFIYNSPKMARRLQTNGPSFSSGANAERIINRLETPLRNSRGRVNHLCLGKDLFIKFWRNDGAGERYSIYGIERLSFSYFISNLMEHISGRDMHERWWFLYPIKDGKEQYKIRDIYI